MTESLFNDIAQGLREAIEYERGGLDANAVRLSKTFPAPPCWTGDQIRSIRMEIPMTQRAFASLMGVSLKTIEAWECGHNRPNGSAARLLQLLAQGDNARALLSHLD